MTSFIWWTILDYFSSSQCNEKIPQVILYDTTCRKYEWLTPLYTIKKILLANFACWYQLLYLLTLIRQSAFSWDIDYANRVGCEFRRLLGSTALPIKWWVEKCGVKNSLQTCLILEDCWYSISGFSSDCSRDFVIVPVGIYWLPESYFRDCFWGKTFTVY